MGQHQKWIAIGGGVVVAIVLAVVIGLYALGGKHAGEGVFARLTGGMGEVGSMSAEAGGDFADDRGRPAEGP